MHPAGRFYLLCWIAGRNDGVCRTGPPDRFPAGPRGEEGTNMGQHRERMAVVAIAMALSVVGSPAAMRWAVAQAPTEVFHIGLSKDLRGPITISSIKHYTCKDPVGKV